MLARERLSGVVGGTAGLERGRRRGRAVSVVRERDRRCRPRGLRRRRAVVRGDAVLVLVLLLLLLVLRQARAVCRVLLRLGRLLVGPSQG